MFDLLTLTKNIPQYYLLINVTILEQVKEFFSVYQTGRHDSSNTNLERAFSV